MAHAAEWGRFYYPDGKPAYEVPGAKGMVKPDIRHAKKLGLLPSVTTICNEAAKPGLERWKREQVLLAALTLPRNEGEPEKDYIARILRDSEEQAKKAAEKGTAIHAAIQNYYEGGTTDGAMILHVLETVKAVDMTFGLSKDWTPEQSFARDGYAGKRDLRRPGVTLDFKTKEFSDTDKKLAWDEHCIQLAAYREPGDRAANVFVSVNNPGLVHIHEWTEDELQRGWRMFQALKDYWYARNNYARP